eukprot:RCo051951
MQLRHLRNAQPSQQSLARVSAICWSPNNKRLAIADHTRTVHLYDEAGEHKDKFPTKAADPKVARVYAIRGLQFSPDSTKLAVAQSDNIVYVYKLGLEWGEKKSICNKLQLSCPVTCLEWPLSRPSEIIFGGADGKVRVGNVKTNKSATLYSTDSCVVSVAASPDGSAVLSGHLDNSIYRFTFPEEGSGGTGSQAKFTIHSCVPYALAWGHSIVACGSDCTVVFYDRMGSTLQRFEYSAAEDKELMCASFNPSGYCVVVGAWEKFRIFVLSVKKGKWEECGVKSIHNYLSVNSVAWKPDGSRLAVAAACGAVDIYDACIRRYRYKGKFEFTYVSHSAVIVKRLSTGHQPGTRILLKSQFGYEVQRLNVYQDRYLVAHTDTTLLLGDLVSCKLSEVPWPNTTRGEERFIFDNPQVCLVYHAGELAVVEYGRNEVLGVCRTEHISAHLVSVRIEGDGPAEALPEDDGMVQEDRRRKVIAHLLDRQTIRIWDLASGAPIALWHHQKAKIDWLELNRRATKLLFRDKARQLILLDIQTQVCTTLLSYCSYVQWVPDSDVAVAQNRNELCVWYSIENPDRVAVVPIKGQVEDIERTPGKTEVVVDEGVHTVTYLLDEALIEFGNAMDNREYERACELLEQIALTPETEAMWMHLSRVATAEGRMTIAERCYAALGDVAKARALNEINDLAASAEQVAQQAGRERVNGYAHFSVQAAMAILNQNFPLAQQIYIENNRVEDAMAMWDELQRYDESIGVAFRCNHPKAEQMRSQYLGYLVESGQYERAGEIKEREHLYAEAIALYLQGGLPGRAAHVVSTNSVSVPANILEAIASSLMKAGMFEKAGDFFEKLQMKERAIEAYKRGFAFQRAVELSRREMPGYVVSLEEAWGDWLHQQKLMDQAINHYIDANCYVKAIDCAIIARQWTKAVSIVDSLDPNDEVTKKFYKLVANHYEDLRQYPDAERYYIKADLQREAVEMYTRNNMWDQAQGVARTYMTEQEIASLYINQAQQMEEAGEFKKAEELYVKVNDPDLAIHMYKKARRFDDMIRLVSVHRKELLTKTHQTLAAQFEREGNPKQAEVHYVQAKEWKAACNMYREAGQWEEAIRVAKVHGGVQASKHVVFAWAKQLGGDVGSKLLSKFGLIEQAIDYAIDNGNFDYAIELASTSLKSKLSYAHLKYAMFLEDEGRFTDAENEFIKANKPKEAIDMYIHQRNWSAAMRVADAADPPSINDVLVAQARDSFGKGQYEEAEASLLKVGKAELVVKLYKEARMWQEAHRVAREHCPNKVQEISAECAQWMSMNEAQNDPTAVAKLWIESGDIDRAIDTYLKVVKDGPGGPRSSDELCRLWLMAVEVALTHSKDKLPVTMTAVAKLLVGIHRFDQASLLYENHDQFEEAVRICVQGKLWDRAQSLADQHLPHRSEEVRKLRTDSLVDSNNGDELVKIGDIDSALMTFCRKQEFPKMIALARQTGEAYVAKYSPIYIQAMLDQNLIGEAVTTLMTDGACITEPKHVDLYRRLLETCIPTIDLTQPVAVLGPSLVQLKDKIPDLVKKSRAVLKKDSPLPAHLDLLAMVLHQYYMAILSLSHGIHDLHVKILVGLTQFLHIIPADKAFYDIGMSARRTADQDRKRRAMWLSYAFVFLNRVLDLNEIMEDPDATAASMDLSELEGTPVPRDFPIPRIHSLGPEQVEDARQWILTASLDQSVQHSLPHPVIPLSPELEEVYGRVLKGESPSVLAPRTRK